MNRDSVRKIRVILQYCAFGCLLIASIKRGDLAILGLSIWCLSVAFKVENVKDGGFF